MKLLLYAAILVLLAACGTPGTTQVDVPVPVSCVKKQPEKPVYATDSLTATSTEFEKIQAIVLDWLAYRVYTPKLEAGLAACR